MLWLRNSQNSKRLDITLPTRTITERDYERINYETAIVYENYETGKYFYGLVINYSKGGLCIETGDCPTTGTGALVHMIDYSPTATGPESIKKYYVEVKWANKITETNYRRRYALGVKHCSDIYELIRLFGH